MDWSGYQENRYAMRVAEVADVQSLPERQWVEVDAYWADDGTRCVSQFMPAEMRLSRGDAIFVIQQVYGPGKQDGAWVCFTSERAPKLYTVDNALPEIRHGLLDRLGAVANALIEIGAVGVLAVLGWQYRWWLAVPIALAGGYYLLHKQLESRFYRKQRDNGRAEERKLFGEAVARMAAFRAEWEAQHGRGETASHEPQAEPARAAATWWGVLGVPRDCSEAQARSAGRALLLQYHPDHHMHLPELLREAAAAQTKRLLTAIDQSKRHFADVQPVGA